jgi:hypothetical protein
VATKNLVHKIVGTTPVQLLPANPARRKMRVTNLGGAVIALGSDATVTCGSGYPLNAGESLLDDAPAAHDAWWAVSCGGAINNGDVRVMEISD